VDERFSQCMCFGLTIYFVNNFPEDGILVPKHVELTLNKKRILRYVVLYFIW